MPRVTKGLSQVENTLPSHAEVLSGQGGSSSGPDAEDSGSWVGGEALGPVLIMLQAPPWNAMAKAVLFGRINPCIPRILYPWHIFLIFG